MEEATNIIELTGSIMATVSNILMFKEDWFTLSHDYKHQMEILKSRLDHFQEESCIHGQPGHNTMTKILEKAAATLNRVEMRLSSLHNLSSDSHCCSYIWFWYAKLSIVLFPENIEKILEKVNEDIDKIYRILKEEGEISTRLQAAANRRPIVTSVNDIDSLYVPIDRAHLPVIKAIEDLQGPQVILLHGGVGKGKSTLARSMIQRYGKHRENANTRCLRNGDQNDTKDGKAFDILVWVSCGNCSSHDISTKQLEILQDHFPTTLGDCPPGERTNPKPRIATALQEFFSDKKVLMILDDVSNDRFLYEMWEATTGGKATPGGKGVKILVTSQWRNICAKAGLRKDSLPIFMEDPTESEAMKILASLVGLEGECIPLHLQPTAKEMIKVTEGNPLALACLASHFAYSQDIEDQQAWQDALKGLRKLLDNPEERLVLPVAIPGKHADPRSLCGAMKICIDSLKTYDAKKILFLMFAFKEESAPELVLRILHASLKRSNCTFSKSRDELGMRELLKIHREPKQPTSLSLRSLVKLYMEQTKMVGENEVKSLLDELVEDIDAQSSRAEIKGGDEIDTVELEKARVAVTLCALYFDLHHATTRKIVTDAMTWTNITYSNDGLNDLRRQAVNPILSLLDKPEDEHWKESDVSSARQVFLTYISRRELDDKNISHLLELAPSAMAQVATLKAVGQICAIENVTLFKPDNLNFLQAILQLLDLNMGIPTTLLEEASRTLSCVCCKASDELSAPLVASTAGVLDVLVSLISIPIHWPIVVAENAARALWGLAQVTRNRICKTDRAKRTILDKEGALVNLIKCLSEHDKPALQRGAAGALAALSCTLNPSLKLRIANQEGALHSLVKLVSSHTTPSAVQEQATLALKNLASRDDCAFKMGVVNDKRAPESLVKLLSMHDKPRMQEQAAKALANLALSRDNSFKLRICEVREAPTELGEAPVFA